MSEEAKEITVYIKAPGEVFSVKVNSNCTVRELATKAASSIFKSKKNLGLDSGLKLTFCNRNLTDKEVIDQPISNYCIQDNSSIWCVTSVKDNSNIAFRELLGISEARHNNLQLSPLKIIVGVIALLLLAATITTFLLYFLTTLSLSVAVPIVLSALFVVFAVVFFRWNTILPKILPKGCLEKLDLGIDLNEEYKNEIKGIEDNKENSPKEEEKKDNQKYEINN